VPAEGSWQPDPARRHQYRWWDGSEWTSAVADDGRTSIDALGREPAMVGTRRRSAEPMTAPVAVATDPDTVPVRQVHVPTYDPAGAQLGTVVMPKPKRHIVRWIVLGVLFAGAVAVAAVLVLSRLNSYPKGPQIVTRTIVVDDGFVQRTVKLRAGEAARFRIETSSDLEVEAYLLVPDSVAADLANVATDQAGDQGVTLSDVGDVGPADTGATDAPAPESPVVGMKVVATICCDKGTPGFMTGTFVAHAKASYRLVVIAVSGTGPVRMIDERFPGARLQAGETDADVLSDPFFSDRRFFTDPTPYTDEASDSTSTSTSTPAATTTSS
jgi:hypothetical protein